ncbi:MAG: 3-dehydroquinate synthase [Gemmatimonadota bacterium]
MTRRVVRVGSEGGGYDVRVGLGAVEELPRLLEEHAPAFRYAIISDSRVAELHAEPLRGRCVEAGRTADLFVFPEGEASKTRAWWASLTDALLEAGHGRDSAVIAVGGGVTTDLAGFVAATFMRGIPVVQVPTSYLAMIDASVGGKTGVDVPQGKNLVGAFHPPALVIADPAVLSTLSAAERVQGLVEAFKHGAALDGDYFDRLVRGLPALLAAEPNAAFEAVARSVELKAGVVEADEREGGYRQVLNFGHTLGHALEAASDYRMGHGTAVAVGMVLEAELGERLGVTASGTRHRLEEGLSGLRLPEVPPLDVERVAGYLSTDKKARAGRPRFVLLRKLGETDPGEGWSREVATSEVREVLDGYFAGGSA